MKNLSSTPAEHIIKDDFIDNRYGWEIVDSDKETAMLTCDGYLLNNKDKDRWHHFSLFPDLTSLKGIAIKCKLEIESDSGVGQVGLIWGFDTKMSQLNRFCISAAGKGCSIIHFERNHRPVFHRFYDPFINIGTLSQTAVLEVREANGYWFFRVNQQLVYIAHEIHFAAKGAGIGFYLDPGVRVRIKKLRVARRPSSKAFSSN